jgi:hypothetical protein
MSSLAAQLRRHLCKVRHPDILSEWHPLPIRYDVVANRAVQLGLTPISHSAFAAAAAAAVAEHPLIFVMI